MFPVCGSEFLLRNKNKLDFSIIQHFHLTITFFKNIYYTVPNHLSKQVIYLHNKKLNRRLFCRGGCNMLPYL